MTCTNGKVLSQTRDSGRMEATEKDILLNLFSVEVEKEAPGRCLRLSEKGLCQDEPPKFQYSLRGDWLSIFFVLDPKDKKTKQNHKLKKPTAPALGKRADGQAVQRLEGQEARGGCCFVERPVRWIIQPCVSSAAQNDGRVGEIQRLSLNWVVAGANDGH